MLATPQQGHRTSQPAAYGSLTTRTSGKGCPLPQVLSEELAGGSADMPRVHMALEALFALARDPGARASVVGAATLPGTLRDWERRLAGMPLEDRDALREESVLIKLLSRVCAGDGAG